MKQSVLSMCLLYLLLFAAACETDIERVDRLIDTAGWMEVDSPVWKQAAEELITLDRTAAQRLLPALGDGWYKGVEYRQFKEEIYHIRATAVFVLGQLEYAPAAAELVKYIVPAQPRYVRLYAIQGLGKIGSKDVPIPDSLRSILRNDPDTVLRLLTAIALCKLDDEQGGEYLVRALGDPDPAIVDRASSGLLDATYHAVYPLQSADEHGPAVAMRAEALQERLTDILLQELKQIVESGDFERAEEKEKRREIVRAFGYLDDRRAIQPLVSILEDDEDPLMRLRASTSLSRLGEERGLTYLFDGLGSREAVVRKNAVGALVEASSEIVGRLLRSFSDQNPLIRSGVAEVVGKAGLLEAVPTLVTTLSDTDPTVRASAAVALGILGERNAREPLAGLLRKETNRDVRYYVEWALTKLGGT
ncbi:MAG: HEAT repeat domain-containing protein [Candidatus Latescibacteria bacterium]|nr:HEAT repeat domain-containing protein [Candidatus Latescibacterota bacterium]